MCRTAGGLTATAAEEFVEDATATTAAAATKGFAEHVEWIVPTATASAHATLECGVTVAIVCCAFVRIFQVVVRGRNFLEFGFRDFVVRVLIWMIFNCQLTISFLKFVSGCITRDAEGFI